MISSLSCFGQVLCNNNTENNHYKYEACLISVQGFVIDLLKVDVNIPKSHEEVLSSFVGQYLNNSQCLLPLHLYKDLNYTLILPKGI